MIFSILNCISDFKNDNLNLNVPYSYNLVEKEKKNLQINL